MVGSVLCVQLNPARSAIVLNTDYPAPVFYNYTVNFVEVY